MLEGKRRFAKSLTTRTGLAFVVTLTAFATLVAVAHLNDWRFQVGDLRLLAAAGVAGSWGATFSMLTGLNERIAMSRIYDLNMTRAITMIVARTLVGAGAACVLFFFLCSGILTGKAFPDLLTPENEGFLGNSTVALLVIWCIVAGFSEKFVPSLLAKTEASAQSKITPDGEAQTSRYRPTERSSTRTYPSPPAADAPSSAVPTST
jgi:hypothetical protein